MPTVGWIREGDWERFLEGTERVPNPGPARSPCFDVLFVMLFWKRNVDYRTMFSAKHHVARPILLLGEKEPMQTSIIRAVTSVRDLALANVTTAEIEIDGGGRNPIPVRELARALSRIKQGEVSLTLTNASQIKATPVSTSYEISFRIADGINSNTSSSHFLTKSCLRH